MGVITRSIVIAYLLPISTAIADSFIVDGNKILDPQGREFVMQGVNIFPDNSEAYEDIVNCWGFNTVRANHFPEPSWNWYGPGYEFNLLESTFADQKTVVILDLAHDSNQDNAGIGSYWIDWTVNGIEEGYTNLIEMYTYHAELYKDNPYMWLELINEPGTTGNLDGDQWVEVHQDLIRAIRGTGNQNPILINGWCWGQDACNWSSDTVPVENSAILSFGDQLMHFDGEDQKNIVFTHHVYDQFQAGLTPDRMMDYHDAILNKGYALVAGEYCSGNNGNSTLRATEFMFESTQPRDIGRIVWNWHADDDADLTTNIDFKGGGDGIDSCVNPQNLTVLGQLVWDDLRLYDKNTAVLPPASVEHTTILGKQNIKNLKVDKYLKNLSNSNQARTAKLKNKKVFDWNILPLSGEDIGYVLIQNGKSKGSSYLKQHNKKKVRVEEIDTMEDQAFHWRLEEQEDTSFHFQNRLTGNYLRIANNNQNEKNIELDLPKNLIYTAPLNDSVRFDWHFESQPSVESCDINPEAQELLSKINDKRLLGGSCNSVSYNPVPALQWDCHLSASADKHASEMASQNYFSHTSLNENSFIDRASDEDYHGQIHSEMLAAGQSNVADVLADWLDSADNCHTLFSDKTSLIGASIVDGINSDYSRYFVVNLGQRSNTAL